MFKLIVFFNCLNFGSLRLYSAFDLDVMCYIHTPYKCADAAMTVFMLHMSCSLFPKFIVIFGVFCYCLCMAANTCPIAQKDARQKIRFFRVFFRKVIYSVFQALVRRFSNAAADLERLKKTTAELEVSTGIH